MSPEQKEELEYIKGTNRKMSQAETQKAFTVETSSAVRDYVAELAKHKPSKSQPVHSSKDWETKIHNDRLNEKTLQAVKGAFESVRKMKNKLLPPPTKKYTPSFSSGYGPSNSTLASDIHSFHTTEEDWVFEAELDYSTFTVGKNNKARIKQREKYHGQEKHDKFISYTSEEVFKTLRTILTERKLRRLLTGHKSGASVGIAKRVSELADKVPEQLTKSWQKRDKPDKLDYVFNILVDLSASMRGDGKVFHAINACESLSRALTKLSIPVSIMGFNSAIWHYKDFRQKMNDDLYEKMREHMMLEVLVSHRGGYNSDGWALIQATNKLERQSSSKKFQVVISDGQPAPFPTHASNKFALKPIISRIMATTKQGLVGLGIGDGTQHVETYYPIAKGCIKPKDLAYEMGQLVTQVITGVYDRT